MALTVRVRHRFFAVSPHSGGAHDVASAFRMGNMPDAGSADGMKQLLVYFARRRQGGRGVII